jgi:AraC family transcriptional regulator of adaptative response/methylated-DNA-[protein]-cysteine methyltransferase
VTGALYEAGYGSSSRLYTQAASQLGMTPGIYKKGGEGMRITYSVHPCALGLALVGVTEYGVCAVYLGDSEPELAHTLRSEYPRAHIQHDPAHMSQWVQAVIQHLDGWQPHLDLPLDLQATAFQRRVWQELQRIPPGETRTYAQIAAALGDPQAARAVAGACASNRLAVIIPCHRVIRSDGTLGGYRWGLARKTALLAREKAHQPAPQIP